jgi:succinate dehydrogenase / fumarate reductase iron-sulfur subunit
MSTPTLDKQDGHSAALDAAENTAAHLITVTLRVRRFNPEVSDQAQWVDYQLPMDPKERVLDALHKVKWEIDGTLTFRRSCAHGVCGSDAMRINGRNRLACKTLIKDVNPDKPITIEPIKGLTVLKDLVVDMDPFFQAYRDVMPFLAAVRGGPRAVRRHHQVHPVRGVHLVVPGVLERRAVLRPGGDRQRAPVHLRLPRRGR